MNITNLLYSFHDKSGEQNKNINTFVANAIVHIIHNYFLTATPSFVLTLCCRNSHTCNFFNDLLSKLFLMWGTPMLQFVVIRANFTSHIPGRRYYNLILVDSFQAFAEIKLASYTKHENHNEFYHIFLQARDHLLPGEMQRILDYCWQNQLINCNVQTQNAQGEVLIYSYFPFTAQHCGKVVPVLVNQYKGNALLVKELFPKKLLDFHGCALRAAIWHEPPFIELVTLENGTSRISGGIEGILLLELARKLNFSVEVCIPPNNEQRGRFLGNDVNGAMGMLHRRTADLSLGCIRQTAIRSANATSVVNYYQSTLSLSVLKAAYDFTSLQTLLFPFAPLTWCFILTLAVFSFSFLSLINKYYQLLPQLLRGYKPTHAYLNLFLVLLGLPLTETPFRHFSRLVCASWLVFTLVLRAVYQALLFHLIRVHVTNPMPDTFDELIAANFSVVLNIATYETLAAVPFMQSIRTLILNTTDQVQALAYIEKLHRSDLAAITPMDNMLYFGQMHRKAGIFKLLPQHIISMQLTMYFSKHSYLIDQFEEEIMWLRSAGLIECWVRYVLDFNFFKTGEQKTDKVFGLKDLYMAFGIGLFGLLCGLVVFILEVLSSRFRLLRKILFYF